MRQPHRIRAAALAVALLGGGAVSAFVAGPAHAADGQSISPAVQAAKDATTGHRYRNGVSPTVGAEQEAAKSVKASASSQYYFGMQYWGSGVQAFRRPRVYIVYAGPGWGTASTDAQGNTVFSNDPAGMARQQQMFYKGIGTNKDSWSKTPTQYCGSIAFGSMECPRGMPLGNVEYPYESPLAAVWYDNRALPATITSNDIAVKAVEAAAHFSQNSNDNQTAQYIISYAPGASPDGWKKPGGGYNYCSWHGFNGDHSLSNGPVASPNGNVAFTVMPYVVEAGAQCGAQYVNNSAEQGEGISDGALDGVTMEAGRQFQQTLVNPFPDWASPDAVVPTTAGWIIPIYDEATDQIVDSYEYNNFCGRLPHGKAGGAFKLKLDTGYFAVLGGYSNAAEDCVTGMAAVTHPPSVLYNPNNRNVEIYANNDGNLAEKYWNSGNGQWSNWYDFGGYDPAPNDFTKRGEDLMGQVVFYNPNNRNVEIYATAGGKVVEKYWNAGNGQWSGWNDLGGNLSGNPKVFYNPNNRNIEIYGVSEGEMVEKYWNASNGQWSGWNHLGTGPGNPTIMMGDPAVLYNPNNRNVEIYVMADGRLVESYWDSRTGKWSFWQELIDSGLSGSPTVFYNQNNRNIEIYGINSGGHLVEKYWNAANGQWSGVLDFGGTLGAGGIVTVLYNPNNRNVEIYANENGHLTEKYWNSGNGQWSGWNDLGGTGILGNPTVLYNPNNRNIEIYVAGDGFVQEKYWNAGNGQWSGWNLLQ